MSKRNEIEGYRTQDLRPDRTQDLRPGENELGNARVCSTCRGSKKVKDGNRIISDCPKCGGKGVI